MRFALNHVTAPGLDLSGLCDLATALGCEGVELRNDLARPLFDGAPPEAAGARLAAQGLTLFALAEVKRFDDWSAATEASALALIGQARAAGARGVALIPCNDGEKHDGLARALRTLAPMLEDHGLLGFIEPLGFRSCALRRKEQAAEAVTAARAERVFRIVHDTFHHALAGEEAIFPELTGIVHVSGVTDPRPGLDGMRDADRVLVDAQDRLGNLPQLHRLVAAGWDGPVSFECFAPSVQGLADPAEAIRRSMDYLRQAEGPTA